MLLAGRNAKYNQKIPLSTGLVNGQALGAVSGVKFGVCTLRRHGCGVLAVYNALLLHQITLPLWQVVRRMERYAVLFAIFGTNPYALGCALRSFGLRSVRCKTKAALYAALEQGQHALFAYWTGKPLLSSIHIVCLQSGGKSLLVLNAYNRCDHAVSISPQALIDPSRMVAAFAIVPPDTRRGEVAKG